MRRPLGDRTFWACNFVGPLQMSKRHLKFHAANQGWTWSVPRTFETRVYGQRWGSMLSGLRRVREVPGRAENGHTGRLVRAQEFRGVQRSVPMPHASRRWALRTRSIIKGLQRGGSNLTTWSYSAIRATHANHIWSKWGWSFKTERSFDLLYVIEDIPCRVAQVAVCAFACGLFEGRDQLGGQRRFDHWYRQECNEQDDDKDDHLFNVTKKGDMLKGLALESYEGLQLRDLPEHLFHREHLQAACEDASAGHDIKCDDCGKAFMLRGDLNRHMKRHRQQLDYDCKVCGQQFGGSTICNGTWTSSTRKLCGPRICARTTADDGTRSMCTLSAHPVHRYWRSNGCGSSGRWRVLRRVVVLTT